MAVIYRIVAYTKRTPISPQEWIPDGPLAFLPFLKVTSGTPYGRVLSPFPISFPKEDPYSLASPLLGAPPRFTGPLSFFGRQPFEDPPRRHALSIFRLTFNEEVSRHFTFPDRMIFPAQFWSPALLHCWGSCSESLLILNFLCSAVLPPSNCRPGSIP